MKLILTLLIVLSFSNIYSQNNPEIDFDKLTDNEKSILISAYKLKSVDNYDLFHKSMDSIRETLGNSHKLYAFITTISADENNKRGKFDNAIKDYNELMNFYPENKIEILHKLSVLYSYANNLKKSSEILKKIIKLNPDDGLAYSNLTNKYLILGKYSKALKVLESYKGDEKIYNENRFYAIIYFNKNKIEKSKYYIDRYINNENNSKDFSGYLITAKIYNKLNLIDESCDYLEKAKKNSLGLNLKESGLDKESVLYKKISRELKEINELTISTCK